jgi:hypothetical protein
MTINLIKNENTFTLEFTKNKSIQFVELDIDQLQELKMKIEEVTP